MTMSSQAQASTAIQDYINYMGGGQNKFLWAVTVNNARHLMEELKRLEVVECRFHPPFSQIASCELVRCGKVWVVVGNAISSFAGDSIETKHEMAMGLNKDKLAVWWDLMSPVSFKDG